VRPATAGLKLHLSQPMWQSIQVVKIISKSESDQYGDQHDDEMHERDAEMLQRFFPLDRGQQNESARITDEMRGEAQLAGLMGKVDSLQRQVKEMAEREARP